MMKEVKEFKVENPIKAIKITSFHVKTESRQLFQ